MSLHTSMHIYLPRSRPRVQVSLGGGGEGRPRRRAARAYELGGHDLLQGQQQRLLEESTA